MSKRTSVYRWATCGALGLASCVGLTGCGEKDYSYLINEEATESDGADASYDADREALEKALLAGTVGSAGFAGGFAGTTGAVPGFAFAAAGTTGDAPGFAFAPAGTTGDAPTFNFGGAATTGDAPSRIVAMSFCEPRSWLRHLSS